MRKYVLVAGLLVVAAANADSLFTMSGGKSGTLIAQKKARFAVGDIITVSVEETVDASTQANTETRKESDIDSQAQTGANAFLVNNSQIMKPEHLPNWQIEAENETRTRGKTTRTNKLVTTVSCQVTEVHANGNIQLEGKRQVTVNREDSIISVVGLARAEDVTPANTIDSSRLADATVTLKGCGPLWNNQRRGIFTKILDWFSPF